MNHLLQFVMPEAGIPIATGKAALDKADAPIPADGDFVGLSPKGIRAVVDYLAFVNGAWLQHVYGKTSAIARAFFPEASLGLLNSCIVKVVEEALWDIGYSPIYDDESRASNDSGEPFWFCDGDPHDALRYDHFQLAESH
ncbi:MAG: hypothetical protein P4L50_00415 [Anaerolineaceae bacterium]|nr:hypothetical protein [Anaerolineaceae bacterium]